MQPALDLVLKPGRAIGFNGIDVMRRATAFSMIELIVVMVVAATLFAIAAPRFSNSLARFRAQAAAQRVVADLALAQRLAKTTSAGQSIIYVTSSNSYSLPGVSGLSAGVSLASDPYQATLVSAVFGSGSTITYDRFGQPSSAGTIVVQSGVVQKTITIDANSGLTSIQ